VELPCVFIIDENAAGRGLLLERIKNTRYSLQELASPLRLMNAASPGPACIVMVQRAAGDGYADLLRERQQLEWTAEVIVLATNATVELAVQAMRMGAFHVYDIEAVSDDTLSATIRAAIAAGEVKRQRLNRHYEFARSMANLSARERDVLRLVVAGMPNKLIAKQLGISIRTVEDRRRNIYHKLGVDTAVQLVTLVLENDLTRTDASGADDPRRTILGQ
jgi:two-component system response regulator DctR